MQNLLTLDDALDAIWEHSYDIASTAVAGKGSVRLTISQTITKDRAINPTFKITGMFNDTSLNMVRNFGCGKLKEAIACYNDAAARLQ